MISILKETEPGMKKRFNGNLGIIDQSQSFIEEDMDFTDEQQIDKDSVSDVELASKCVICNKTHLQTKVLVSKLIVVGAELVAKVTASQICKATQAGRSSSSSPIHKGRCMAGSTRAVRVGIQCPMEV